MFNESLKAQRDERKKVLEEYKRVVKTGLYNGWDIGYKEPVKVNYKGVDYEVEPAWTLIVDAYGYNGSVELSHKEGLGFSVIKSSEGESDSVDFRFAESQDTIDFKPSDKIKTIYLNSINIRYSYFDGENKYKFDISKNSDIIDFAVSLNHFIKGNKKKIDSINFQNLENLLQANILKRICDRNQVNNISFNTIDEQDNHMVHRKMHM